LIGSVARRAAEEFQDSPLAILVATGGTEAAIREHVRRRQAVVPFEPALLIAHPLHNSLPAALEALARIHADGGRGRIVQVDSGDVGSVETSIGDVAAIHKLHHTRLGQVGEPSPWLVASVPDLNFCRVGRMVPIDITDTIRSPDRRPDPGAVLHARHTEPGPAEAAAPSSSSTQSRAHVVVTVRCFDYLDTLATSGCVALAELNNSGVVAGCEGDVASAVAMLLVQALLDQPSWIANPATVDERYDRLLLAHCTVAPSLVDSVELHTHFESGLGIGLRGYFAPGPVTLLRLGGPALGLMSRKAARARRLGRRSLSDRLSFTSTMRASSTPPATTW
jgi:L-fucose isomerase-like protein